MDYDELKEKIKDMSKKHGVKYAAFWAAYYLWKADQEKLEEEAKESLKKIQEEFDHKNKEMEIFKLQFEHPEYFPKIISPKEYGMSLNKKRI